ncbi:MAG: ATP-binding response regulator [Nevskiales bacterium]
MSGSATATAPAKTLEGELLDTFANQGIGLTVGFIGWFGIVTLIMARHIAAPMAAAWFVVSVLHLLGRRRILGALPTTDPGLQRMRLRVPALLSAIGAVIHVLPLGIFPVLSLGERAVISLLFLSNCTGGASAAAGYGPVFYPYIAIALGSLALAWGLSPDVIGTHGVAPFLAVLVAAYGMFLIGIARNNFRAFKESYEIRSQQRELNEKLSDALAQAESANRAKTRFLASASHDLRQPIHTLSLFSAALSMQKLDDKTRDIANHMNVALETLASQLDALLDVSKLDAGVMEKHVAVFDLNPMLKRLAEEFRSLCADNGLRFEYGSVDQPVYVETDAALLERVLRNLLANAVKYTDAGAVSLRALNSGGQPRLQISDTGRGIPAGEHERVFEEFYQLENPERDRRKGLGLGLAIVRRLVDMLGIGLTMQSAPGVGTTFELQLAAAGSAALPAAENAREPDSRTRGLRVLVIDDEAAVRTGMQTLLEAMGYEVALADSTEHAVQEARAQLPQLLLADLRLRGSDTGIQAIQAVRELVPRVPALLISGDTAPARLKEAQQAGIKLLHKPVALSDLRQSIHEVCGQIS